MQGKIEGLCAWLVQVKGIKQITVEDLTEYLPEYEEWLEENKAVWTTSSIVCDLCGFTWIAVYHKDSEKLECPNCQNFTIIN